MYLPGVNELNLFPVVLAVNKLSKPTGWGYQLSPWKLVWAGVRD